MAFVLGQMIDDAKFGGYHVVSSQVSLFSRLVIPRP